MDQRITRRISASFLFSRLGLPGALAVLVLLAACSKSERISEAPAPPPASESPTLELDHVVVAAQSTDARRPVWRASARDVSGGKPLSNLVRHQAFDLRVRFAWRRSGEHCQDEYENIPSQRVTEIVQQAVRLDLVLIADDRYFDVPEASRHQSIVASSDMPDDTCDQDGADPDPAIAAAAAHFQLAAGENLGRGVVAVVVYRNGRPIDEIAMKVCVGCQDDERLILAEERLDEYMSDMLNDVANEPETDASLFNFDFAPAAGAGILALRQAGGEFNYYAWSNSYRGMENIRDRIANTYAPILGTETDAGKLAVKAEELSRLIFSGAGGNAARVRLETFLEEPRPQDAPLPSLFVRISSMANREPLVFPIGFMAMRNITDGTGFIGLHARVVMPLGRQYYETFDECPQQIMAVLPDANHHDDALKQARLAMGDSASRRWWQAPQDSFRWNSTEKFGEWLLSSPEISAPTALFVLTHHHNGSIWIDPDEKVESDAVTGLVFDKPSWAVLNGCSTIPNPVTSRFAFELNKSGAQSVITTLFEVNAQLAGSYFECMDEVLARASEQQHYDLGRAHFEATECLWNKRQVLPGAPAEDAKTWGPNALKYILLGNPNLRVCPIKERT